jgi:hypothetical protein
VEQAWIAGIAAAVVACVSRGDLEEDRDGHASPLGIGPDLAGVGPGESSARAREKQKNSRRKGLDTWLVRHDAGIEWQGQAKGMLLTEETRLPVAATAELDEVLAASARSSIL